ncbi:LacI family DNA-binding transcriptional regulator [Acidovorax sp. SUPP2522]|uniref:LacI family DNA-binding transcriptional regulator n=1 Tax=unclassified Acidovorax TaxID=2684926 RepID=UPI002349D20C|nr:MULTISPECIES: LacI family DNA-binding transcriptional regulator [unclassified Acidovorax]WCM95512.1 LacI family DNA-binding transcriptional regulator [Acidovorax sp. GBBC 1281]GKS87554.1 LacI family DNA-binding transcriptional regulator [Acidovorax sp. SUPP1855]GKT18254.1 LacI family DNA-binding transcriptional regulator [Acidovorax sp. SUPP2522]
MTDATRRPRRSSGRITLDDVARDAAVSPITVSRVLRGERSVDAQLAERVRASADRLGYVPDPAARALASQRSTQVLVLVPMLSNTLFVDLLEAVHRTLFPEGFHPLIGVTHYDTTEEELLLRTYLPHRPAGLLVTGFDRSETARQLIARSGVPCVHLMETSTAPDVACVGFSQTDAGAAITRHLLDRGRRRIAFCAAQLDPRTLQRAEGYRRCLREAGLYDPALEVLSPERSSVALGARLFEEVVRRMPGVDAIFFCNDDIAQGGLLAANRLGVAVPGRIAVAGFNDLEGSDQMVPPLTTVRTPRAEVGRAGAAMLLGLMRGAPTGPGCVELGYELVVRGST